MEKQGSFMVKVVLSIIACVALIVCLLNLLAINKANEIMVIQSVFSGKLTVETTPGPKFKFLGSKVTRYPKRDQFWFSSKKDQGKAEDESIKVRFNDGGHANLSGSLSWEMPLDTQNIINIHQAYCDAEALENQLIKTATEKSVYMTGPLMSSKESYAELRTSLIQFIENQLIDGVFATYTVETKTTDTLTGQLKTVNVVQIRKDDKGNYIRAEDSPIKKFSIKVYNLSINEVKYDDQVEKQINEQQKATMDVQIALANSKKAEQDALTVAKQGEAKAVAAKWAQEEIKAKAVTEGEQKKAVAQLEADAAKARAVTEAEQKLQVAKLDADSAEQFKRAETLRGEGEAARRKAVMEADGALSVKLDAYTKVNSQYAEALKGAKLVPEIVFGGSSQGSNNATDLIQMLTAKTAKDLSIDFNKSK